MEGWIEEVGECVMVRRANGGGLDILRRLRLW